MAESPTRMQRAVPLLQWLPQYKRAYLSGDIFAGLIVGALCVTEGVAYSGIVGVPVIVGLSAIPFALIAYALLGSSRQLIVGPLSTMAVISGSVVVALSGGDMKRAAAIAAALAIATGLVLFVAAILRLGWIAEFLSRPIIAGFVSGLVVIIVVTELPELLGMPSGHGNAVPRIESLVSDLGQINWATAAVGITALVILFAGGKFLPQVPWSFVVLVLAIPISAMLGFAAKGIETVGAVPGGLPTIAVPAITTADIGPILAGGAALAVVGLAEGLSVARLYAIRGDYRIRTNQEFVAQGASNVAAGLFGGFAICGSLVKTAASSRAKGQTQMASLVAAALGLAVLLGLDELLGPLPKAILAAVVIHAVAHMFAAKEILGYRKVQMVDFIAAIACFLAVLLLGPLDGLLIGIGVALLGFLYRWSRAHTSLADEHVASGDGVVVMQLDSPLFWPNSQGVSDRVRDRAESGDVHTIVLDLAGTTELDATSAEMLRTLRRQLEAVGVTLVVACPHPSPETTLRNAGVLEDGAFDYVRSVNDALPINRA